MIRVQHRRAFEVTIATLALGILLALTSCAPRRAHGPLLQRHERTSPQMGLPFRIVVYSANEQQATNAIAAAFARISRLNDILSDYDIDSELSRLSRTSGQNLDVPVSADLWQNLRRAQELAKKTDGAFDVTIGPVVNLWRRARRERALPRPDLLQQFRNRVGWQKLHLDSRRRAARLDTPEMRLDLGGIAKGYAVDEAMKVLRAHGIRSALVSGGGDLAVSDAPPGRPGWQIELAPIDHTNAPPARHALLRHAALATSGDVFQHVEIDGRRYSHIVDPRTGLGLTDHSLVTIIARDCTTADSLATAVSVLGPVRGLELIRATRGVEGRIIRAPDGRLEVRSSAQFERWLIAAPAEGDWR